MRNFFYAGFLLRVQGELIQLKNTKDFKKKRKQLHKAVKERGNL